MKHVKIFSLLVLLCSAVGVFAQGAAKPATPASAPQAPPTIAAVIDREVGMIEKEFVDAAEAMPEDKFNFAPANQSVPGSDFKGVRTFAQQVKHVATVNFMLWGTITGDKPPVDINNGDGPASMTSKADIVKYLKDSYALGHRAAKTLTAENIVSQVPSPFGPSQTTRLFCATFSVAHGFDHYGQMVEYLRMNGIIPPASRGNN